MLTFRQVVALPVFVQFPAIWRGRVRVIYQASAIALLMGSVGTAAAQAPTETTVDRSVRTLPNRDTQIGVFLNVLPDCTSGPLPTIRLVSPPAAGKVVVKTAKA